jgi:hypothetical protein
MAFVNTLTEARQFEGGFLNIELYSGISSEKHLQDLPGDSQNGYTIEQFLL